MMACTNFTGENKKQPSLAHHPLKDEDFMKINSLYRSGKSHNLVILMLALELETMY
jgi:hypothetical protein